jgi:hypothetical protein
MATISKCWLLCAVACLGNVFSIMDEAWAQSPTLSITLTGQSMVRSDIRAHAPAAVPTIASLLGGDVVFTNFEATIIDVRKGQSPKDGRFVSPRLLGPDVTLQPADAVNVAPLDVVCRVFADSTSTTDLASAVAGCAPVAVTTKLMNRARPATAT